MIGTKGFIVVLTLAQVLKSSSIIVDLEINYTVSQMINAMGRTKQGKQDEGRGDR